MKWAGKNIQMVQLTNKRKHSRKCELFNDALNIQENVVSVGEDLNMNKER